jgi:TatD DNase family protein
MVPSNIYTSSPFNSDPELKGKRFPLCHTAMIPWTAEFVAAVANEALNSNSTHTWDAESVMRVARENARRVYGI